MYFFKFSSLDSGISNDVVGVNILNTVLPVVELVDYSRGNDDRFGCNLEVCLSTSWAALIALPPLPTKWTGLRLFIVNIDQLTNILPLFHDPKQEVGNGLSQVT